MKHSNLCTPRTSAECHFIPSDDPIEHTTAHRPRYGLLKGVGFVVITLLLLALVGGRP